MKWGWLTFVLALFCTRVVYAALQDPSAPAEFQGSDRTMGKFVVQSILFSPRRQVAIVNGEHVVVGDKVDEAKVTAIANDFVKFREGDSEFAVPLNIENVKNTTSKGNGDEE